MENAIDIDSVPSLMSKGERLLLYETAGKAEGDVIEIGSWKGGSTILIAAAVKNGKVYAVDHHRGTTNHMTGKAEDTFKAFEDNIRTFGVEKKIIPIRKTSEEASAAWGEKKVGMLFIDGDHSYSGVKADIDSWTGRLQKGGFLVFHDLFGGGNDGVRRAVLDTGIADRMRYLKRKDRLAIFVNDGKTGLKGRLILRYVSGLRRLFWYMTRIIRPSVWKKHVFRRAAC